MQLARVQGGRYSSQAFSKSGFLNLSTMDILDILDWIILWGLSRALQDV